jgi:hypothetical protein
MLTAIPLVSLVAGCGASSTTTTTPTSSVTIPAATSAPVATPTAAPPTAAPAVDLTGSWSGQYSGTFNGTFTLSWTQSTGKLSGDIAVSTSPNPLHVSGDVVGSAITFGAVDGVAYTGSVSGNSMSGTYTVPGGGGGNWSATKS